MREFLSGKIDVLKGRLEDLRDRAKVSLPGECDVAQESLEELGASIDELSVANEALRISNEKLAIAREQAIREHRRYEELFECAPDCYLVTDIAGTILEANRSAEMLLGISRRYLTGKALAFYVAEEDRPWFRSLLGELSGTESIREFEVRLRPRSGELIHASVRVLAVPCEMGGGANLRWLIRDVTTQRETRRALDEAREQLHRAERLVSVGTVAAEISHEIRNPIHSIRMAADYLLSCGDGVDPGELQTFLNSIVAESKRCEGIVNAVLRLALENKGDKIDCDLNGIVQSAQRLIAGYSLPNELTFETELMDGLPPLRLNPVEIEEVIVNLAQNAAQAAEGPVRVVVRTGMSEDRVFISVHDDGPGIPQEVLAHIFNAFYTTRKANGGTGLGLFIVRGIVQDHGGTIRASSLPGRGACFTIELPIPTPS